MGKYIDVSKVTIPKGLFNDLNVPKLIDWLNSQPAADVVSMGVHQQVRWERDIAIEQLAGYGVGFAEEKKDLVVVVRCKDCKHRYKDEEWRMRCRKMRFFECDDDNWFCPNGERKADNA